MIPRAITREELAALPVRRYEGEVNVVTKPAEIERAMEDIRAERVVGFDTETRPAFKKGESYLPCLMQVATARRVHVLQLSRVDCSAAAAELLGSRRVIKAGVGLTYDLGQLERLFPFDASAVLDLGEAAKRLGFQQSGVRNLAGLFLGFRIPKGAQTSNWALRQLSEEQLRYAATDAWACRELYLRMAETIGDLPGQQDAQFDVGVDAPMDGPVDLPVVTPTITGLSPASLPVGTPDLYFTLLVYGQDLPEQASVLFDGNHPRDDGYPYGSLSRSRVTSRRIVASVATSRRS